VQGAADMPDEMTSSFDQRLHAEFMTYASKHPEIMDGVARIPSIFIELPRNRELHLKNRETIRYIVARGEKNIYIARRAARKWTVRKWKK
jgi:hypothetical protein